jgi:hypothetical protein
MAVAAIVLGAAMLGVGITSTMTHETAPTTTKAEAKPVEAAKPEQPKVEAKSEEPKEPLPPGWTEEKDAMGETYYVSPKNHSQWERPTAEDEKRKEAKHAVAAAAEEVTTSLAENRRTHVALEEAEKKLESARSAGNEDVSAEEEEVKKAKEEDEVTLKAYNKAVNDLEDAEAKLKTVTGARRRGTRRVQTFRRRSKRSSKNERQRLGH